MRLSFWGAAREVTGSCHLVEAGGLKLLLDCGMIQGGKDRHLRNREDFPFSPGDIDFVLLSHAHIDHSGRLPRLVKSGYPGPIVCSAATRALCGVLLPDAGRIQEEDAAWKIKRLRRKRKDWKWVEPLFTEEDARETLLRLESVPFRQPLPLNDKVSVRFVEAGHILGASIVEVEVRENGAATRLVFSGDLGVPRARLLDSPRSVEPADTLIIESTYGNRVRDPYSNPTEELYEAIRATVSRGGRVIIPAFAVGRTQEILARVNDLVESGRIRNVPVYVDSPMAVEATRIFASHPEAYSERARRSLHAGDKPLEFPGLTLNTSVEGSKALNALKTPAVIISASGMCTAGRIKHHLKHNIGNPACTILFVGYQAQGSLGRIIESGADVVRIFGEWLPVRAQVTSIDGFSAHADRTGLLEWFESLGEHPQQTFVVHGEEQAAVTFADTLLEQYGAPALAPHHGDSFELT